MSNIQSNTFTYQAPEATSMTTSPTSIDTTGWTTYDYDFAIVGLLAFSDILMGPSASTLTSSQVSSLDSILTSFVYPLLEEFEPNADPQFQSYANSFLSLFTVNSDGSVSATTNTATLAAWQTTWESDLLGTDSNDVNNETDGVIDTIYSWPTSALTLPVNNPTSGDEFLLFIGFAFVEDTSGEGRSDTGTTSGTQNFLNLCLGSSLSKSFSTAPGDYADYEVSYLENSGFFTTDQQSFIVEQMAAYATDADAYANSSTGATSGTDSEPYVTDFATDLTYDYANGCDSLSTAYSYSAAPDWNIYIDGNETSESSTSSSTSSTQLTASSSPHQAEEATLSSSDSLSKHHKKKPALAQANQLQDLSSL